MKILKFGGKSLSNGVGIQQVVSVIEKKYAGCEDFAVVVSARDKATDELIGLLHKAKNNEAYYTDLLSFINYQQEGIRETTVLSSYFQKIEKLLEGVRLLGESSKKITDHVISYGEIISARYLTQLLLEKGIKAVFADTRELIITDSNFGNAQPINSLSSEKIKSFYAVNKDCINIFTGFIGSTQEGETTTLGRNGTNYSAALIANYLEAEELQNYTHVDGIFTANPQLVQDVKKIDHLSFEDANELASFGMNILHAKTIIPLVENRIPLRILNTFNPEGTGTLISSESTKEGIKSISVLENISLIKLEGRGLLGKTDIDSRIFRTMSDNAISVSIISQGSSERGLGFAVNSDRAEEAVEKLKLEFEREFHNQDLSSVRLYNDVAAISIVGQDLSTFHRPYAALIRNHITPILLNNSVTGKNISLLIEKQDMLRAINVVHGEIFGIAKKINLAVFGHGLVGSTLIQQILNSAPAIEERKGIKLNIFAVANSGKILLNHKGINTGWREEMEQKGMAYCMQDFFDYVQKYHLENLIAIDNTASTDFVENYMPLIDNSFDLVSSNKIANTLPFVFYKKLRQKLDERQKTYLYETNVGAGLPLIDTIKLLHLSGENITRIKGVFSGSLSYIFNHFSVESRPFSEILRDAIAKGYTEPDPREDLSGNDVARKLLILARELDLENEFDEINIQSLIPEELDDLTTEEFLNNLKKLDQTYDHIKKQQNERYVLRYIGDLYGDLQQSKGILDVKLVSVPENSVLGQLQGSDSIFEIYTESYGQRPLVIQGAGAGASVTARGVFGDILRLVGQNNSEA